MAAEPTVAPVSPDPDQEVWVERRQPPAPPARDLSVVPAAAVAVVQAVVAAAAAE
jgi:hypothetical protein